MNLNINCS